LDMRNVVFFIGCLCALRPVRPCIRNVRYGADGTRTRDLLRDRQAF
jgi:hypothetical protein